MSDALKVPGLDAPQSRGWSPTGSPAHDPTASQFAGGAFPGGGSPGGAPPPLHTVDCLVWVADRRVREQVQGMVGQGGDSLLCFREQLRVINATHLAAVLESRLQGKHQIPITIGLIEYHDETFGRWMPLQATPHIQELPRPVRLRVWGRKRRLQCVVLPLRQTAARFAPRAMTLFADSLDELCTELKKRLPESEQDFGDVLYRDPGTGAWVLLEDVAALPPDPRLKLVPSERSLLDGERRRELRRERGLEIPDDYLGVNPFETGGIVDSAAVRGALQHADAPDSPQRALPYAPGDEWGDLPARRSATASPHAHAAAQQPMTPQPAPYGVQQWPPADPRAAAPGRLHPGGPCAAPSPFTPQQGVAPAGMMGRGSPMQGGRGGAPPQYHRPPAHPQQYPAGLVGTPRRAPSRSEQVYQQQPPPREGGLPSRDVQDGAMDRLRHQVKLEAGRLGADGTVTTVPAGSFPVDLPVRQNTVPGGEGGDFPRRTLAPQQPEPHIQAEVKYLHCSEYDTEQARRLGPDGRPKARADETARDQCCYPGSGQLHSCESSGHGDLKRALIKYVRKLLQEHAPGSPLAPYLPLGGLTTQQLVGVTSLAAHHFMVRCPSRPGEKELLPEDKAAVHTILAHILSELPGKYRAGAVPIPTAEEQRAMEEEAAADAAAEADARRGSPPPLRFPRDSAEALGSGRPVVVLMRPMLAEDHSLVLYGTVTCTASVTCRWRLRRDNQEVAFDDIFANGLAITEPVSASSFCLRLLPGSLPPGSRCEIELDVTSDADGQTGGAQQNFDVPPHAAM